MTYTLVPKVLPGKEDGQRLYYAQSRARGELGLEEMAERISRNCTLTRSDIIGVLAALEDEVCQGLCNGEIVRLGGIGSLQAEFQDLPAKDGDDQSHDSRKNEAEPDTVGNVFAQAFIITGTKTLGDRDGKATAHAHAETDDEKVDGSGGTDGGEGIHTQKLSNDDGIYQTVELLKEHTHQKRQGETKDQ